MQRTQRRQRKKAREMRARMAGCLDILEEEAEAFIPARRKTIELLKALVEKDLSRHECARKAKVFGSAAGLVGAGMVVGGALVPTLSPLLKAGAVIGCTGTAVAVGGVVGDIVISNMTAAEARQILEDDNVAFEKLTVAIKKANRTWKKTLAALSLVEGCYTLSKKFVDVNLLEEMFCFIDAVGNELELGLVGTSAALITVFAIPFNLYVLLNNINRKTPKVVDAINGIINSLEVSTRDVNKALSRTRRRVTAIRLP